MARVNRRNPYGGIQLRQQIYLECRAMAEFAMAKGKAIPPGTVATIESFVDEESENDEYIPTISKEQDVGRLVTVHGQLAAIVEPATPQTILLLDVEQETPSVIKFLGPVGLVRQLMVAALISLVVFIAIVLSPDINDQGGNIFTLSGLPLLLNLLFYLSAAGLGASFAALYKANQYITTGTYDPAHQASYWIRFILGLISGLMLAVLISENAMKGTDFLEEGVIRPLLAILGGFSADLLYTVLNRLVEAMKSLFQGSAKQLVETKTQEIQARLGAQLGKARMKAQQELMKFQQQMGEVSPELKEKFNALIGEIAPAE